MDYMLLAIEQAKIAAKKGEVPIGCVIVRNQKIVSKGRNMREKNQNALAHAEVVAIEKACKKLGSWRLDDCELYVTCEPCPMCAGAILNSRIQKVVYGCTETKSGACGGKIDILGQNLLNHKTIVQQSPLSDECGKLIKDFFAEKRTSPRKRK